MNFNPQLKTPSWRSNKYLKWILKQPVLISGQGETVYHHIRIDGNAGMGLKPSDYYCVPLPKLVHDGFHAGKESDREFWEKHGIDIYRELFRFFTKWNTENENTK